jgi:diguanylate cyclase (GGDEF)-like protein
MTPPDPTGQPKPDLELDGEQRDDRAELRDDRAALRNELAVLRDQNADLRAENGVIRDEAGAARDDAQASRDAAGAARSDAGAAGDQAAEERDRQAEYRDRDNGWLEAAHDTGTIDDAIDRAEAARGEAGDNRRQSSHDRSLGAADRAVADHDRERSLHDRRVSAADRAENELDRDGASADRQASAGERADAGLDRGQSSVDRGASAVDREDASLDSLTGVYLRGPGLHELDRDIARSKRTKLPFTLAFVDVDQLKGVNDTGGHAAGDRLLRAVAQTLRTNLRPYDVIVRYGGDEFVCGLSGLDQAAAKIRLADVNHTLADAPEHGSVTVGVAELSGADTLGSLISKADTALYEQRNRGKDPASPAAVR